MACNAAAEPAGEHRQLMPQHRDLDLVRIGRRTQAEQAQQPPQGHQRHRPDHHTPQRATQHRPVHSRHPEVAPTGVTQPQPVVDLHHTADTDLTNLVVATNDGQAATIHTTQHHPFWSETRHRWTDAAELTPGEIVHTTTGVVAVQQVANFTDYQWMLNLTVANLHTYYVMAGGTAVLVHNAGGLWPFLKGLRGEEKLIAELRDKGFEIRGTQISMRTAIGVNVRIDVVAEKTASFTCSTPRTAQMQALPRIRVGAAATPRLRNREEPSTEGTRGRPAL
jgi:hypothetical protein